VKRLTPFLFGLFLLSLVFNPAMAQDSWNVTLLGEVHDFVEEAFDVAMAGDYAYLSSGLNSGLRVLDLSDPTAPEQITYAINTDECPGVYMWMTDRIRIWGDRAYLLYFDGTWSFRHYRLYIYDISDPSMPQQLGFISLPDECTNLFVEGNRVYVTVNEMVEFTGVKVIDVSDPAQPVEIGSFQTPGMPQGLYEVGDIAYIADNNALLIYDLADPGWPEFLGSYAPSGGMALIHDVALVGDYVYVIDAAHGIRVLDASNPEQIEEVGSIPHNQNDATFSRMVISGDRAYYLQDGDISGKQLISLDVSDPTDPQIIGSYDMPGFWWCYGFDSANGYASIACGKDGLRVVDVSHPDSLIQVAHYDPCDLTSGLAVWGDYAFVGTYMNDLVVYDVSDPAYPVEVTTLVFDDSPIKQISTWGGHLYVPGVKMDSVCGVSVLDIGDPASPEQIAYWPAPPGYSGIPFNVERHGDYALVACAIGGVEVYDVSQIDQPVPLDNWTLWSVTNQDFAVTNVKVSWPYVFAPDRAYGLYVLDVSNPTNITEVASYPTPGEAMWADISSDHNYVYVADFTGGLRVIDVSDPLAPAEIGFWNQNLERAVHVAVCGDSVYVADGGVIGLHVFDVSDPTAPMEVAYHKTPGAYAHDVVVVDGLVHFLDYTHFEIFEVAHQPTGAQEARSAAVVSDCRIHSAYPNPFNATTKIVFDVDKTSRVTLQVYNIIGQKVQTLVDGYYPVGRHSTIFRGEELASGIYLVRLESNGVRDTRKLVLVR
jgi:hypothetical protein